MLTNSLPPVGACAPAGPHGPSAGAGPQSGAPATADGPDSFACVLDHADARRSADQAAADEPTVPAVQGRPAPAGPKSSRTAKATTPERPTSATAAPGRDLTPVDVPVTDETSATATQGGDAVPAPDAAAMLAALAALAALPRPRPPAAPADGTQQVPADGPGRRDNAPGAAARSSPVTSIAGDVGAAASAHATTAPSTAPPFAGLVDAARAAQAASEGRREGVRASGPGTEAHAQAADAPPLSALPLAPPAAPTLASAPASAQARLPASPGGPDFASQLAAQLTTFVRDGVQHAQLELHPVELGPVTVQIRLDGANAQVHLAAESAPTRQALEQAMPALAGSLRECGLTLSGGGVFDQPRQPADSGAHRTAARPSGRNDGGLDNAAAALLPVATSAGRRRGVVDLVA